MSEQRISKIYDYRNIAGKTIFQVVRFEPKGFAQRRPYKDGFIWGLGEVEPILYHLPEVTQAIGEGKTVFICEGEKDADNLAALGLTATTCPMGAGKWRYSYTDSLKDCREVIALADKDAPGRTHAALIASSLFSAGIPMRNASKHPEQKR